MNPTSGEKKQLSPETEHPFLAKRPLMPRLIPNIVLRTFAPLSFAQFTFTPANVPGAVVTQARGINANGAIVSGQA
jgi:hypothetical protein